MKKIGLLGGYGSVGRYALAYLHNTGKYELYASGRDLSKVGQDVLLSAISGVVWSVLDVTNWKELEAFVEDKDIILNTVSFSSEYSAEIAALCVRKGKRYVDAGISADLECLHCTDSSILYGAGALPGLSAVLAVYAAESFQKITSFTHITAMEGVFSRGAAYDYLKGISADISKGNSQGTVRISGAEIPFVGIADMNQYIDKETRYVSEKIGFADGVHYLAFGSGAMKSAVERAVLTFSSNPEEAVQSLMDFSYMHNRKSCEHMTFVMEAKGRIQDGTETVQTMVLKFASSAALTGTSAGLCTEMLADAEREIGILPFCEFPDSALYPTWMPHIVSVLKNSHYTYLFETYPMSIDALNEESTGEI